MSKLWAYDVYIQLTSAGWDPLTALELGRWYADPADTPDWRSV